MHSQQPQTHVAFKSTLFSFAWPEDIDSATPWGEDCAAFFVEQLRSLHPTMSVGDPYADEFGWSFDIFLDREHYEFFVQWIPVGNPPTNYWAITLRPLLGVKDWLFRKPRQHFGLLLNITAKILESSNGFFDVSWMNKDAFCDWSLSKKK